MRRILAYFAIVLCLLALTPARPSGHAFPTVTGDLLAARALGGRMHPTQRMRVIVQSADGQSTSLRGRMPGTVRREIQGGLALDVTGEDFDRLSKDPSITHISTDLPVVSDMAITNKVTGAPSVWQGTSALLGLVGTPGYNGTNVGVAIVDSGIAPHSALGTRVAWHVNLVSWEAPATGDPFGHGTHLAGIVGGSTSAASTVTTAYAGGSAPGVKLIDVRVLGRNGVGLTSDVIAGIDWATDHRKDFNIKVINLSLGHPVMESSTTDPLCLAVARAVAKGVTVVVSAGNYGLTTTGKQVLGGITSPGNSPLAITVGATDTAGTLTRSDDRVAPYSSRGPTRYDNAVKPDLVAPGTRITSLESTGSYLSTNYPAWHIAGTANNAYMRMSGTSMATAVVSGGAALLLNANPSMTPAQVKIALQMGTTFVPQSGLLGAGTGEVSFPPSMKIAKAGLVTSLLNTVTSLLGLSSGAAFHDTDRGSLIQRVYDRTGIKLLGILDLSFLFGDPNGGESGVLHLLGTSNPLGYSKPNYLVWGDVAGWTSNYYLVWGDSIQDPSGQYLVWGNNEFTNSNYLVWGDAVVPPDGR